ncbi:MAG: DUF370 domain-containing protein [Clostridia bacterium]|jgi:hypothetical protein|nr:DUF370 domain-containing protein [Clostridia bacterium]
MYLHIGKDFVINNNSIIGIFNLNYIRNTREFKNLYDNIEKEGNIRKISEEDNKSFILTEENKIIKGYVTNIGTNTIGKRKM